MPEEPDQATIAEQLADDDDRDQAAGVEQDTPDDPEPDRAASRNRDSSSSDADDSSKSKGRKRSKSKSRPSYSSGQKSLQGDLEQFFGTLGTFVSAVEPFDGAVILEHAPRLARQLDWQARSNPALYKILRNLTTGGSGAVAIVLAFAPVVIPILHHHGLLPDTGPIAAVAEQMTPEAAREAEAQAEAMAQAFAGAAGGAGFDPTANGGG